ncbi:MAG: carboxypeptidase-like regulatory domain-containing protein [Thermoguttaceae bacterium]
MDPEGRPVTGVTVYEGLEFGGWRPQDRGTFRIDDYRPDRPQTLLSVQHERKLAGSFMLQGPQHGPLTVRLQPWGAITGRIVDAQGKPQADVFVIDDPRNRKPMLPPQGPIEHPWSGMEIKTDPQGRFAIKGLAPGVAYDIDAAKQPDKGAEPWIGRIATGIVVRSGETKDLGDLTPKLIDLSALRGKESKSPTVPPKGP